MSEDELRRLWIESCANGPQPWSQWRHYGGAVYEVITLALIEVDKEPVVVYRRCPRDSSFVWCRPLSQWNQEVQHNGETVRRFTEIPT